MSSFSELIQFLESFERYLGNPHDEKNALNFQQTLRDDEQEILAWPQLKLIQQWGFMEHLIPREYGGKMDSLDDLYHLNKLLARRDLTLAIAIGLALFGALPIWIAGTEEQKRKLSARLREGDIVALALTEQEHGSDLTANEVYATAGTEGWEVSGQKWCINFATMGQGVSVLSRTHEKGGVLGFSLLYIDKSIVKKGITYLPKLPTHGVRGLDISGFSLDKVQLPQDALIGKEGQGLEITYKVFQMSRTLCACLSVGGADTALRLAFAFSQERHLYGKQAFEIPAVKQQLGVQITQLLIADCTALAVARACTVFPEKMSFWSAIIKFLIPKMCDNLVEQCGVLLGARAYLRTTQWAIFQKIRRDIQVVGLFDGSTQVNLSLIASNLAPQAKMRGSNSLENSAKLEQMFNPRVNCPAFFEDKMRLFTHQEDDVLAGINKLDCAPINHLIALVRDEIKQLDEQVEALRAQQLLDPRGLAAFRLAENYCWIFAASCCLQFWFYNQKSLPPQLNTDWLTLAIQFILQQLNSTRPLDKDLQETMAEHLKTMYEHNQLFAVIPVKVC